MAKKKIGNQTIKFENPPTIMNTASVVGPKEGEGPLKDYFDKVECDDTCGENTFEKAENHICKEAVELLLRKEELKTADIDYYIGGDLLNQIICSSFTARDLKIPYFGVYGACSTFAEAMQLASVMVEGEFAEKVVVSASSHFSSAERQYRFPLELGNQRPMTSQWTVTGAGAAIITKGFRPPYITHITTGVIQDYGIKDANNMGTAMAPAAVETIITHFKDTGYKPEDYDLIITGDLASIGKDITMSLLLKEGYDVRDNYTDCGFEIFDNKKQDTHSGGSGAGCSAVVFSGYLFDKLLKEDINRILFVPTGALLSTTSAMQGESIPCIAHAVTIENTPQLGKRGM